MKKTIILQDVPKREYEKKIRNSKNKNELLDIFDYYCKEGYYKLRKSYFKSRLKHNER